MMIDTKTMVSMTDANQDFSKVAKVVDTYGSAVIFENDAPRYLVIEFPIADTITEAMIADVLAASGKMLELYDDAFRKLAK